MKTRHRPTLCPGCGCLLSTSEDPLRPERRPQRGNLCLCRHCGVLLTYREDLTLERVSAEREAALSPKVKAGLELARRTREAEAARALLIRSYIDEAEGGYVPIVEYGNPGEPLHVERLPMLATKAEARTLLELINARVRAFAERQGTPVVVDRRTSWGAPVRGKA